MWYCLFEDCRVGATNSYGAGNFHVYKSVFRRSTEADVTIGNTGYPLHAVAVDGRRPWTDCEVGGPQPRHASRSGGHQGESPSDEGAGAGLGTGHRLPPLSLVKVYGNVARGKSGQLPRRCAVLLRGWTTRRWDRMRGSTRTSWRRRGRKSRSRGGSPSHKLRRPSADPAHRYAPSASRDCWTTPPPHHIGDSGMARRFSIAAPPGLWGVKWAALACAPV